MRRVLPLIIALGFLAALGLGALAAPPRPAAAKSVTIIDFVFQPRIDLINLGDTVTWTNSGAQDHTATNDTALWDSGTLTPTATFSFTFNQVGVFSYHCELHPDMTGTLIVADPIVLQHLPIVQHSDSDALTATAEAEGVSRSRARPTPTATAPQGLP